MGLKRVRRDLGASKVRVIASGLVEKALGSSNGRKLQISLAYGALRARMNLHLLRQMRRKVSSYPFQSERAGNRRQLKASGEPFPNLTVIHRRWACTKNLSVG